MPEFLDKWLAEFGDIPVWLLVLGLIGQSIFFTRFLVQWIASERAGRSVVPDAFWWISIGGSLLVLVYGVLRAEPILILGQSMGTLIYTRNLMLIHRVKKQGSASGAE